jgi:hypothetical protein
VHYNYVDKVDRRVIAVCLFAMCSCLTVLAVHEPSSLLASLLLLSCGGLVGALTRCPSFMILSFFPSSIGRFNNWLHVFQGVTTALFFYGFSVLVNPEGERLQEQDYRQGALLLGVLTAIYGGVAMVFVEGMNKGIDVQTLLKYEQIAKA